MQKIGVSVDVFGCHYNRDTRDIDADGIVMIDDRNKEFKWSAIWHDSKWNVRVEWLELQTERNPDEAQIHKIIIAAIGAFAIPYRHRGMITRY